MLTLKKYLNSSSACCDKCFNSRGIIASSKLLLLRLSSLDDGNGQKISVDLTIKIQDLVNFFLGFFVSSKRSVTFLPEEFASTEERLGMFEFPPLEKKKHYSSQK